MSRAGLCSSHTAHGPHVPLTFKVPGRVQGAENVSPPPAGMKVRGSDSAEQIFSHGPRIL